MRFWEVVAISFFVMLFCYLLVRVIEDMDLAALGLAFK